METIFTKALFGYNKDQVNSYVLEMGKAYEDACQQREEIHKAHQVLLVQCQELQKQQQEAQSLLEQYSSQEQALSQSQKQATKKQPAQRRKAIAIVADVAFYVAIAIVVLAALTFGAKSGAPRTFMGYSALSVLTSSMQNEIPKGSLVLIKQLNPAEIKVGDIITYMRDANTSITHKVIKIYDNYQDSGSRGFETQGVNNINPDADIVAADNVVGVVIFHLPGVGAVIMFLGENIGLVLAIFALLVVLSLSLKGLFAKALPVAPSAQKAAAVPSNMQAASS